MSGPIQGHNKLVQHIATKNDLVPDLIANHVNTGQEHFIDGQVNKVQEDQSFLAPLAAQCGLEDPSRADIAQKTNGHDSYVGSCINNGVDRRLAAVVAAVILTSHTGMGGS